jgi:ABC-type transporter Mla subunit MlaD
VLRVQSGATRRLIRNTGEVFSALSERQGQLRELIRNSNRVWEATASRDANLADTFRVLPTFLREGRTTTTRLSAFAEDANPLIDQLRPAARQLSPALADLDKLSPDLRGLFQNFKPLVRVSREGLPATSEALNNTRPFLGKVDSFLRDFTPIVDYLGLYKREIAAFFANAAAVTQAKEGNSPRYLRTQNPVNPEIMAAYPNRISTNRSNPYPAPGGADDLATYLKTFGSYLCTSNPVPALPPGTGPAGLFPDPIRAVLDYYAYGGSKNRGAAPPCTPQAPLGPQTNGGPGLFPRLQPLP